MVSGLMTSRRFAPLFWCQFFSAFNDNLLKNALVFLILFGIGGENSESLITLAGAVFIVPFFMLSALGGEIADRFDKATVAQWLKLAEIAVAALAVGGFYRRSPEILFASLFGFGVISALFGPIKYGILPDHLKRAELPAGNALVEGATFIAILAGTIVGGLTAKGDDALAVSALVMAFALLCWGSARLIPQTGRAAPGLRVNPNVAASTFALLRAMRAEPRLWWGGLVVSWFWLVGAVVLSLLPPLVKTTLGGREEVVTLYLAVFSVAVAAGSALASRIANGRIVLRPIVVAAVLMGAFSLDLGVANLGDAAAPATRGIADATGSAHGLRLIVDFAGLAAAGGLFIVPAFSAVQAWAGADRRARTIAAVNVLNAAFMTAAGLAVALMQKAGVGVPALFVLMGAANLVAALAIARTMPSPQERAA